MAYSTNNRDYYQRKQLGFWRRTWLTICAWSPVVLTAAIVGVIFALIGLHQYTVWSGCLAKHEYYECAAMLSGGGRVLIAPESTNGR